MPFLPLAVLAILLVHSVEHFIYPVYADPATQPGWLNTLDQGTFTVVFSLFAGKQCAAYGGIEFDLNPIEIYEYCDMIEYMSNFMTGLNIAFQPCDNHQIQLQILDSRNGSIEATYGDLASAGVEDGRAPLLYTLNWNGSFFQDMLRTRWSFSILSEAESNYNYFYALGNQFVMDKFNIYLDFYLSNEGVSLLENAAHLGLPVPEKIKAVLEQLHDRAEKTETEEK